MSTPLTPGNYVSVTLDTFEADKPRASVDTTLIAAARAKLEQAGMTCHDMEYERPLIAVEVPASGKMHHAVDAIRRTLGTDAKQLVIGEVNVLRAAA